MVEGEKQIFALWHAIEALTTHNTDALITLTRLRKAGISFATFDQAYLLAACNKSALGVKTVDKIQNWLSGKGSTNIKKKWFNIFVMDILKVMLAAQGHDRVLIGSYWHTGARKGEVLRWTWADDINFDERWVRLGTKKSKTGEMVYEKLWMNDDLHKLLMWQWQNRHPTSPYVFCHMNPKSKFYGQPYKARWKLLKNLCKDAQVELFGYHDIRHTVAKYLNDLQKVNLKKVQQVLRHRRQTTTEIYVEGNYTDTKDAMTLLENKNLENFS